MKGMGKMMEDFRQLGGTLSEIEQQLKIETEIIENELHIKLNKWELQDEDYTENEIKAHLATEVVDRLRKHTDLDFDYTIESDGISISII
jgi:methionine salvage enolase-phosphatase E1